jgi:hypothetical protein
LNKLLPLFKAQKKCVRIMFGDSKSFSNKFKACARSRSIQCEQLKTYLEAKNSTKPSIKQPCAQCVSLKKQSDKKVRPHQCQVLGEECYTRESNKPLFKYHELLITHNRCRFRCIMETIKVVRNRVPISMYDLFKKSEHKDDLLIIPEPSINFAYNGAYLWNKFIEQSQLRGKLKCLSSIKCQLRFSILNAQHQHDDYSWHDTNINFTTFLSTITHLVKDVCGQSQFQDELLSTHSSL